jgi:hypothetical protein
VSSRLTCCADERAVPDWIVVGMTIRMVMNGSNEGVWVETVARVLCYEMPPMAHRFVVREEPSATPLIDIRGCERSNREHSDEAALLILVRHALKVLGMKPQKSVD